MTLLTDLAQFCGTIDYHATTIRGPRFVCTDGMLHLAETAGAYWLLDAVASYQGSGLDQACDGFQLWQLRKLNDKCQNAAELTCWRDTPTAHTKPVIRQLIPYTDFPFDELGPDSFQFFVEGTWADRIVALLKSEH